MMLTVVLLIKLLLEQLATTTTTTVNCDMDIKSMPVCLYMSRHSVPVCVSRQRMEEKLGMEAIPGNECLFAL